MYSSYSISEPFYSPLFKLIDKDFLIIDILKLTHTMLITEVQTKETEY